MMKKQPQAAVVQWGEKIKAAWQKALKAFSKRVACWAVLPGTRLRPKPHRTESFSSHAA
jgi:hypothetical protein